MKVTCHHCPRECVLEEQQRGYCFTRRNIGGKITCTSFGRTTGLCIDPVEKKPLMHFYPGSRTLSFGSIGCNMGCLYCQNWYLSHAIDEQRLNVSISPENIASLAVKENCQSVAYTYNEPIIWAEYAEATAAICRERGIRNIAVTAGYISAESRPSFFQNMDAVNIDLKGFSDAFYEKYCHAHLSPVLETIAWVKRETPCWLELTNLVIPRANDDMLMIRRMCDWIVDQLGEEVPLHFSAFYPHHKLVDRLPTPFETLKKAYDIAHHAGLKYVYLGNVRAPAYESTWCPKCGQIIIGRDGYRITQHFIRDGFCEFCGARIAGHFLAS